MESFDPQDLDRLVEAKLKEAPLRPAPLGLYREVRKRVAATAAARREQRRFQCVVGWSFLGFSAVALLLGIAAVALDVPGHIALAVPGILGYFDYVTSTVGRSWPMAAVLLAPAGFLVIGAAVWFGLRSAR